MAGARAVSAATGRVSLGPIAGVTITAPDLAAIEATYSRDLGYRVVDRGQVTEDQANLWQAPAVAGARVLLMAPAAGDDFRFRFIEMPAARGYRAFSSHGWNAAELIVADVDSLADRLASSGFTIVAPPMDLSFCTDIRAMQVRGPAGEILYLTQFKRPVPGLDAPPARCPVDRTFIVIVGGPSVTAFQDYYAAAFGVPVTSVMESRVQAMALEFGLPREHRFRLTALPLQDRCYVEADEMPAAARPLPGPGGELPTGIAIVSFRARPGAHGSTPGDADREGNSGDSLSCRRGPAGELLELIGRG